MLKPALFILIAALSITFDAASSAAQRAMPTPTRDFIDAAAQSDQFEIVEGQLAAVQSRNTGVREFGGRMIRDHTMTAEGLRQVTERAGMAPPLMGLGGDQARLLGALQSLRGPDFDKAYAAQQVLAHDQALVVQQQYASGGAEPNIRQTARVAIPIIQRHLALARKMQAALGGS